MLLHYSRQNGQPNNTENLEKWQALENATHNPPEKTEAESKF